MTNISLPVSQFYLSVSFVNQTLKKSVNHWGSDAVVIEMSAFLSGKHLYTVDQFET